MTDLYAVDARYGSNALYKELADKAKEKGIGLIMDQVANHIGSSHPWMADLPSKDWVNQWPEFTQTNHMKVSRFDPHAAEVGNASEQIMLGKQDVMFAGGGEELDWTLSCLFDAMGAMSSKYNDTPEKASRIKSPFDEIREAVPNARAEELGLRVI